MTDKHQSDMYLENRILKVKDNSLKKYQDIRGDMIERSYPKQNKLNASDNTLVIVDDGPHPQAGVNWLS